MTIKQKFGRWVAEKAFGLSQLAQMWLAGTDIPDSSKSKPNKPYKQVTLVYTCVNKSIRSIAGLPLVLSTVDEKLIESGPAYDLLLNNPAMSWQRFVSQAIGHYALTCDVFFIFIDTDGTRPKEIRIVSGKQMHPVTHDHSAKGVLLGWEFRGVNGERTRFGLDEVYQWKNFNPYDRFHGLGPVEAAQLNINYSFAADLYNSSALANGAEPGAVLTSQGRLDRDQIELLRSQFDSRHKGAGQAKRTAVLTGGMDIKSIAMKMTDMQVAKITAMSDNKICSAFGVPPGVAGLITEAQYSHGPAMRDFIFNTILPLAKLFGSEITAGILSKFTGAKWISNDFPLTDPKDAKYYCGSRSRSLRTNKYFRQARSGALAAQRKVFAWLDASQHPVVQEHQRETAEKVLKFTEAGVPLNDLIETHDLPYEQTEAGKHWWVTMGRVPASYILEAGVEGITGPSLPEGEPAGEDEGKSTDSTYEIRGTQYETKADEQQRLRVWRNWVISWAGLEREYSDTMRQYFLRQQRVLITKLKKALTDFGKKDVTKDDTDSIVARIVFDLRFENQKIKVINHTFFDKGSELGIRQSLSEVLGLSGDELAKQADQVKRSAAIKKSLITSSHKITSINATTQNTIAKQLRSGLDKGEGLNELTGRIKKTLGSNRARALSIARTQAAGAVDSGRHAGMKAAGVELKAWITSGDDNVRNTHKAAGVTYAKGIFIDQAFEVGGESLMYPGDPAGSAANIINCRCLEIARKAAGKTFDLTYYANKQFYSYPDMQKAQTEIKDNENGKD